MNKESNFLGSLGIISGLVELFQWGRIRGSEPGGFGSESKLCHLLIYACLDNFLRFAVYKMRIVKYLSNFSYCGEKHNPTYHMMHSTCSINLNKERNSLYGRNIIYYEGDFVEQENFWCKHSPIRIRASSPLNCIKMILFLQLSLWIDAPLNISLSSLCYLWPFLGDSCSHRQGSLSWMHLPIARMWLGTGTEIVWSQTFYIDLLSVKATILHGQLNLLLIRKFKGA